MVAYGGISTDIHKVNGELKANWAATLNGSFYAFFMAMAEGDFFFDPEITLRYVFKNNTGVKPFTFGFGLGCLSDPDIFLSN